MVTLSGTLATQIMHPGSEHGTSSEFGAQRAERISRVLCIGIRIGVVMTVVWLPSTYHNRRVGVRMYAVLQLYTAIYTIIHTYCYVHAVIISSIDVCLCECVAVANY